MRVSTEVNGVEGNGDSTSYRQAMSGNGQFVVFASNASNFLFSDTNDHLDIFVRDVKSWTMSRASISSSGAQANGDSTLPAISSDGAYVAFDSAATNLVSGDNNGHIDVFIRARLLGITERVSVGSDGIEANQGGTRANVTTDGQFVVFESHSDNLVRRDSNGDSDIFVHDRMTGMTERVSVSSTGIEALGSSEMAHISGDGRFVVFQSNAPNLVVGDTNNAYDVFIHDRFTEVTTLMSRSGLGMIGNAASFQPSISDDGRWVGFSSDASNFAVDDSNNKTDAFLHDTMTGVLMLVSRSSTGQLGNDRSDLAEISADGHSMVFRSAATNLVAGDSNAQPDLFVRDLQADFTTRVSFETDGSQFTGPLSDPSISGNGQYVSFWSTASDVVPGDTNQASDAFVIDTQSNALLAAYGVGKANSSLCVPVIGASGLPSLSGKTTLKITATQELGSKPGMFFWGHASASIPFHGGTLLVASPIIRTGVVNATGSSGCSGAYSFWFDQNYIQQSGLSSGDVIYCQFWSRDPGFLPPNDLALSNGLQVTING
jgi:hypothetical protein